MNIQLSPALQQLVQKKLESGRYHSVDEMVGEALRLLEHTDQLFTHRRGVVRDRIEEGWRSAECGDLVDGDEVFDRLDAELAAAEHSPPK